jgi:hypothetical protein
MALLAAACMVVLAEQATVFGVALLWFLFSAFQNGEYASGGHRRRDRGLEDQERQLSSLPSQDTTLSSSTTSAYFACRSNRADSCGPGSRSPTA